MDIARYLQIQRYEQIFIYEQILTDIDRYCTHVQILTQVFGYPQICTDMYRYKHIRTDIGLIHTDMSEFSPYMHRYGQI